MTTSNAIFLVLWVLIFATGYFWINKNKYPKINAWIVNAYQFFNFKKKILEVEFDLNNKSDVLKSYITDPIILVNFENKVCKSIYINMSPKPTTLEINQYFEGIFLQEKLLFEGLVQLSPKNLENNYSNTFYDFVNFQAEAISKSLILEQLNYTNPALFESIEQIFINDPSMGFKVFFEEQLELLHGENIETAKIYDWLAKNKSFVLSTNPNNTNFNNYFIHLVEYYKTKVQLIQNANNHPGYKKESNVKIKPKQLKDILINGMTEEKFRKVISENFETRKGKYFTRGKKQFEIGNNLFKYFYELLEAQKLVQIEPYVPKVDRAKIIGKFFNIQIDPTEYSRDSAPNEQNNYIIKYILSLKLS